MTVAVWTNARDGKRPYCVTLRKGCRMNVYRFHDEAQRTRFLEGLPR